MVDLTRDSSPEPNWRAWLAVLLGAAAAAAIPIAIALAEQLDEVDLTDTIPAIPVAAALGLAAAAMGARARRRSEFTLGRVGGSTAGSVGRWLGLIGVYIAVMAALAIGVYGLLALFD